MQILPALRILVDVTLPLSTLLLELSIRRLPQGLDYQ